MTYASLLKLLAGVALAVTVASVPAIARDGQTGSKDKKEAQYPNATRVEPKLDLTSEKEQKALNAGLDAVNEGDQAKANVKQAGENVKDAAGKVKDAFS